MSSCFDLLDLEWGDPVDTDHSPEASLVHSDEAKALQGHLFGIVSFARVDELVRWRPFCEGACVFPFESVVDCLAFRILSVILFVLGRVGDWLIDFAWWSARDPR